MKITVSKYAGFCPGVRRAANRIENILTQKLYDKVYILGELIHNQLYLDSLYQKGAQIISLSDIESIASSTTKAIAIAIRTHGISKEDRSFLEEIKTKYSHVHIEDLTCPYVKTIHDIASKNTNDKTVFLHYCIKDHDEAKASLSYANGEILPFSSLDELKTHFPLVKIPILSAQTTQNLVLFKKIVKVFEKLYTNAKIFDTICSVTLQRQEEAIEMAHSCDLIIVIGGKNSSNSRRLYEICKSIQNNTIFIENVSELDLSLLNGKNHIGITAGASTPDEIITEVYKKMTHSENFEAMLEESLTTLHTGDIVTGTVYAVTEKEIHLDLGAKFTGVIEKEQITDDSTVKLTDMFKIGDEVKAFVIHVKDGDGVATLSKKRVDADESWLALAQAKENGEALVGIVTAAVKGGVTVSVNGNRVFVPASQTGIAKEGDLTVLVGTTQKLKLLEFDAQKKRALGSIKAVLVEEKKAREEAIFASLEVGKHYMGVVKNLTPYGAFVDIGGVDGMVHNTELSWKRIKHPSAVVKVGQEIDVFIKELDVEKRRISLGYKTQENDTWFQFTQKYQVGDVVSAKIVSLMPFGAFAEVFEDVDGLIHISRISTERVNSPADVLSIGQVVDVKIVEIDDENRKLALSIRALQEEAKRAEEAEARAQEEAERAAEAEAQAQREAEERAEMAPYIVGSI